MHSGVVKTCYWVTAMLLMMGGMTYSVYALTSTYLSYPISVVVNVRHAARLVFPAVTVCNMSPVTRSAMQAADLTKRKRRKRRSAGLGLYLFTRKPPAIEAAVVVTYL